jgi:hypothetical protein
VSSFDVDLETSRQLAHLGASLEGQNSGVVLLGEQLAANPEQWAVEA